MEFLRFGSSIPGGYWGCCAMCIIQNFKFDPDAKASIQLVDGDGGSPLSNDKGLMFAGPTYKDIFLQRLRYGTFGSGDMPNHGFLAVLTESQVSGGHGKKWLAILKEQGFEFIRTVDNSVYTGTGVISKPGKGNRSSHKNYVFGLFRNVGGGAVADAYTPPSQWTDLPTVVPEAWASITDREFMTASVQEAQLPLYNALPKGQFLSEKELEEQKVPITYAGQRSTFPQELREFRQQKVNAKNKAAEAKGGATPAPFMASLPPVPASDFDGDDDYDGDLDMDWGEESEFACEDTYI